MNAASAQANATDPLDRCTVVVIYDDNATRARALTACDCLVDQIWESVELDFHWWRTDFLKDQYMARAAAYYAIAADFLVVCSNPAGETSRILGRWFESWISRRLSREGAFIDLITAQNVRDASPRHHDALRDIAKRGGFDYLGVVAPQSPEQIAGQSGQPLSSTLPDPLGNSRPPSRFGLNE
jgi:hypothetical protein